jgi:hypothetical protein
MIYSRKETTMQFTPSTAVSLALIFVLAFLAETLTEYFAAPWVKPRDIEDLPDAPRGLPRFWLRYIAALVGIALSIAYRVDILALFGLVPWTPWIGYVLTGVIIGRGANYLNDLVDRWLAPVPIGHQAE